MAKAAVAPRITGRKYRCFYTPLDSYGRPVASSTGVLPFVQVKAPDGEAAQRAAHKRTGCPVSEVVRMDHAEA